MIANKCVICRPLLCLLRCWWFCCRHRLAQKFNVVVNGDKSFTLRFILQCYRILCKCYHGNHLVATSKCSVEMDKFSILQFHNFLRNTITFWNDFSCICGYNLQSRAIRGNNKVTSSWMNEINFNGWTVESTDWQHITKLMRMSRNYIHWCIDMVVVVGALLWP